MRRVPRTVVLAAVLVLAGIVAAVLLLEFDSPVLGRAALARIGTLLGGQVDARAFRFRIVRGLALEGLTASSPIAGGRFSLEAESLLLDHRLWPMLGGRVEIERIVVRRPRLRLEQGAAARPAATPSTALPGIAALALRVVEARIDDGVAEVVTPGQPPLVVAGLDFTMREVAFSGPTLAGLTGKGRASADSVRFARTEARDVEGDLEVHGGTLTARPVKFRTSEGRFEAMLTARLDRLPLAWSLELRGDPLDLNAVAGLGSAGTLGPARVQLSGQGTGSSATALRGQGTLHMDPGKVPASPVMQRLQAMLTTELIGARYEASDTRFRLVNGRVEFDSLQLRADPFSLDMKGWVALDGPLELAASARAPRANVNVPGVPPAVLDGLTGADGYVVVPLTITGTQREPVVRPDMGAVAARGAGSVATRKAGKGLLDWLRRRRSPSQ